MVFIVAFLIAFSVLGVGGCLLRSCGWSLFAINTLRHFRLTSLTCDPTLIIFRAGSRSVFWTSTARPPTLFQICSFNLFLLIHCLILHLFSRISRRAIVSGVETRKNSNKTSGTSPKQRKVHECTCDVVYVLRCESVIFKVATLRELFLLLLFFFLLRNKTTMKLTCVRLIIIAHLN